MTESIVEVSHLRKSYGKVEALKGISFEVRKGEVFTLIGPNGAGKTTTLEIIEGLRKKDSGEVRVFGMDVELELSKIKPRIGVQLQRLRIATTLVSSPELLFLDEPTTGLDPQSRRYIWKMIEGLREEGRTVLLTTHYMEEAETLADLVRRGVKVKHVEIKTSGLEDVFLNLTGKELRD